MRRILIGLGLLVVAVVAFPQGPAVADQRHAPAPPPASTAPASVVVNRCRLYAGPASFGADCAGGSAGRTVAQILDGEKFAECRYDPVPADVSVPDSHAGEDGAWWLKSCLKGIKPNGAGDFDRTDELVWIDAGRDVPVLTAHQAEAWQAFHGIYPSPVAQFGPATLPRILMPTFVWLTPDTSQTIRKVVWDGTRDVTMEAYVASIKVDPGKRQHDGVVPCDENPPAYNKNAALTDQANRCIISYDRSSATMPGFEYAVSVEAMWAVRYQRADGGWTEIGHFPVPQVTRTRVEEIQSVAQSEPDPR